MTGELAPSSGDIRPHGHLKMGRFTQHFVDVLNLEQTPLEFFNELYPNDPHAEQCKVSKSLANSLYYDTWMNLSHNVTYSSLFCSR